MLDGRGKTEPGSGGATIKSIADALELSPSTVSRALRGQKTVRADTTQRVQDAARHMGYRRDYRGVNLRTGRTNTLSAILATQPVLEFGDPAAMHLIQGMIAGVAGTDLKLVIQPVIGAEAQLAALKDAVEATRVGGVIIDHTQPDDPRVRYLIETGIPFVTFGRTRESRSHAYFDIDDEDAAKVATAKLAEAGHRRIALVDPPVDFLFSAQRRQGYLAAIAKAGLPMDPALIVETAINPTNVQAAMARLLALPDPPTGFVLSNEVATLAAVRACRQAGCDLARVAFVSGDGTRFFDFFEPGVSSCYFPRFEAGEALARMLVQAVGGTPIEQLQQVVKTRFIVRR